jgi:transposase InsO family protein
MNLLDAALVALHEHGADTFGGNVKKWCQAHGVSRATWYRHRDRVAQEGSWTRRSTRPKGCPHGTPEVVRQAVLAVRARLPMDENGAESIRYELDKLAVEQDWSSQGLRVPARCTIHRLLVAAGLVAPQPRKRPKRSWRRFTYARPRDCYQIDATVIDLPPLPVGSVVFEVLDDCTRTLVSTLAWGSENIEGSCRAMQRAFSDYGVPGIVLCDNGAAFSARLSSSHGSTRFTRLVTEAGSRLIHSSPYHPQTCGKVERHHRTFKSWLRDQPVPRTLAELQQACDTYQRLYNTQRRHSVHNAPPQQVWDRAPCLGGPEHLPVQQDAHVATAKVTSAGVMWVRSRGIQIGQARTGQRLTVVLDGDHLSAYDPDGTPLGHLTLDYAKRYQGHLHT